MYSGLEEPKSGGLGKSVFDRLPTTAWSANESLREDTLGHRPSQPMNSHDVQDAATSPLGVGTLSYPVVTALSGTAVRSGGLEETKNFLSSVPVRVYHGYRTPDGRDTAPASLIAANVVHPDPAPRAVVARADLRIPPRVFFVGPQAMAPMIAGVSVVVMDPEAASSEAALTAQDYKMGELLIMPAGVSVEAAAQWEIFPEQTPIAIVSADVLKRLATPEDLAFLAAITRSLNGRIFDVTLAKWESLVRTDTALSINL